MVAYELYHKDKDGQYQFISLLPERRKNLARITQGSITEWGKTLVGNLSDADDLYFIQIEV